MTRSSIGIPVVGIAGALFCVLLIYLALQVRAGNDPAIGPGRQTAAEQAPRQVLVRRVIITRIVEEDPAPVASGSGGSGPTAVASARVPSAPAAPAPVAAAPAPAPVVSGGS